MILWTYLVVEIVFVPCAPVGIIFKCASLTGSVSLMPLVPWCLMAMVATRHGSPDVPGGHSEPDGLGSTGGPGSRDGQLAIVINFKQLFHHIHLQYFSSHHNHQSHPCYCQLEEGGQRAASNIQNNPCVRRTFLFLKFDKLFMYIVCHKCTGYLFYPFLSIFKKPKGKTLKISWKIS